MEGVVYKYTSPSGKVYIGQTSNEKRRRSEFFRINQSYGGCCTKQQPLSQNFTIPIYSTTALTGATVAAGSVVNSVAASACQNCSRAFVSETPLTITTATAG